MDYAEVDTADFLRALPNSLAVEQLHSVDSGKVESKHLYLHQLGFAEGALAPCISDQASSEPC